MQMIGEEDRQTARRTGAVTATASVAVIATLYAIMYLRAHYIAAPPAWYGLAMAVPHAMVALLFLRREPGDFAPGLARGVAIATAFGTIAAAVIFVAGMLMALAWMPVEPVVTLAGVADQVRELAGPYGLRLLVVLLFLQFGLWYAARYTSTTGNPDLRMRGLRVGLFTLLVPLGLAFHSTTLDPNRNMKKSLEQDARKEAEEKPIREALAREHGVVGKAFLTVPGCLRQGCLDSLLNSLRSQGYAAVLHRESTNHFWVAVAKNGWSDAYVTDETGIVLSWPTNPRRLSSASIHGLVGMKVVDSTAWAIAFPVMCYKGQHSGSRAGVPKHIDKSICGIPSDTGGVTTLRNGAVYRIRYTQWGDTAFTLSARPLTYGTDAVRSFLFNTEGPSYVTTEDRAATSSDTRVYPCEILYAFCNDYDRRETTGS
jgi:hypothetical protein